MQRRLPKRHDLAPLLRFRRPVWSPKQRRLAGALTIEDLRRIARRRTPRPAFDYTDGAADGEVSLARAREAFADVEFRPEIQATPGEIVSVDDSGIGVGLNGGGLLIKRVQAPGGAKTPAAAFAREHGLAPGARWENGTPPTTAA